MGELEHVVGIRPYSSGDFRASAKPKPRWLGHCSCGWHGPSHQGTKGKKEAQEDALRHQAEHRDAS